MDYELLFDNYRFRFFFDAGDGAFGWDVSGIEVYDGDKFIGPIFGYDLDGLEADLSSGRLYVDDIVEEAKDNMIDYGYCDYDTYSQFINREF